MSLALSKMADVVVLFGCSDTNPFEILVDIYFRTVKRGQLLYDLTNKLEKKSQTIVCWLLLSDQISPMTMV